MFKSFAVTLLIYLMAASLLASLGVHLSLVPGSLLGAAIYSIVDFYFSSPSERAKRAALWRAHRVTAIEWGVCAAYVIALWSIGQYGDTIYAWAQTQRPADIDIAMIASALVITMLIAVLAG